MTSQGRLDQPGFSVLSRLSLLSKQPCSPKLSLSHLLHMHCIGSLVLFSVFDTRSSGFDNSHRQFGAFALLPTAEPILGLAISPQLQSFVSLGQSPPAPWTAQQTAFSVNANNLPHTLATHLGHSNLFQCSLGLVLVNLAHHHQHIAPPLTSSIHPPT